MMFENLIKQKLVHKGTWLGVCAQGGKVYSRVCMEHMSTDGDIVGIDYRTNEKVKFSSQSVAEIDGMSVDRFLAQADLDDQGEKLKDLVRRGRKPKQRT